MGRKPSPADDLPRGVTERVGSTGKSTLYIHVVAAGRPRKVNLRISRTRANVAFAVGVKQQLADALARGTLDWHRLFPHLPAPAWVGGDGQDRTLRHYVEVAMAQMKRIRSSTRDVYGYYVRQYPDDLMDRPVRLVTAAAIKEWIAGLNLAERTVRNYVVPMAAAFEAAVDDKARPDNPLERVSIRKLVTPREKVEDDDIRPYSQAEVGKMLAVASPWESAYLRLALGTGMRPEELFGLRWDCVTLADTPEASSVRVARVHVYGEMVEAAKTQAGRRTIPLVIPAAWEALRWLRADSALAGGCVLLNPRSRQPIMQTNGMNDRRGWWASLHRRAKVEFRSPKQTRHTFASTMLMRGESLLWVSKVLGHKKPTTTLSHYARFIPGDGPVVYTPREGTEALFSNGPNRPNIAPGKSGGSK